MQHHLKKENCVSASSATFTQRSEDGRRGTGRHFFTARGDLNPLWEDPDKYNQSISILPLLLKCLWASRISISCSFDLWPSQKSRVQRSGLLLYMFVVLFSVLNVKRTSETETWRLYPTSVRTNKQIKTSFLLKWQLDWLWKISHPIKGSFIVSAQRLCRVLQSGTETFQLVSGSVLTSLTRLSLVGVWTDLFQVPKLTWWSSPVDISQFRVSCPAFVD